MTYAAAPLRQPEDREGLLALWMEVMTSRSTSTVADWRFSWLFDQNPAGSPTSCVTHHVESQSVVACGSAHPRPTQVGSDDTRPAGILSDFAVSKRHRTAGAALAVQRKLTTDSLERFDFIYGCPNKDAEPIFKRLGFHTVGITASYSRLLRTGHKLEAYIRPPWLAHIAGAFVDRVIAASDMRVLGTSRRYRTHLEARADERFDDLWKRARHHYGITGERSSAYLNWRYADFRTTNHRFFVLTERKSKRLAGYVVFSIDDDNVVVVSDFFCDEPRKLLERMLLLFSAAMRNGKNRSIRFSLLADRWYENALRRALFVKRPESRRLVVKVREGVSPEVALQLKVASQWFMVGGEVDT